MPLRERGFLRAPLNGRHIEGAGFGSVPGRPAAGTGLGAAAHERQPDEYRKRDLANVSLIEPQFRHFCTSRSMSQRWRSEAERTSGKVRRRYGDPVPILGLAP